MSQVKHHQLSYEEPRPQSRGRTSGGYFEPGSMDQPFSDSKMEFQSQQKPLSPEAQMQISDTRGNSIQQQSMLDHGNLFTPQVRQRPQNGLLMDSRMQNPKEAPFVNIYGPDATNSYGQKLINAKRPNITNQRPRGPRNVPLEMASTISPLGQVFTPAGSTQTGFRTRDNMSTEYQNFLKMTKPLPTEPEWAATGHNSQLARALDPLSRGDQRGRNGTSNFSQDLLNNFAVTRNQGAVTQMVSPNSRFGVRQLEPLNHPPTVLSRGTHRPFDGAGGGYTFV